MAKQPSYLQAITVLAIFLALLLANNQQCEAAARGGDRCNVTQQGMLACMPAITGRSPSRPSARCCWALKRADMGCLCEYKNSPMVSYLHIDPKLAMALPAKCKLRLAKNC